MEAEPPFFYTYLNKENTRSSDNDQEVQNEKKIYRGYIDSYDGSWDSGRMRQQRRLSFFGRENDYHLHESHR